MGWEEDLKRNVGGGPEKIRLQIEERQKELGTRGGHYLCAYDMTGAPARTVCGGAQVMGFWGNAPWYPSWASAQLPKVTSQLRHSPVALVLGAAVGEPVAHHPSRGFGTRRG